MNFDQVLIIRDKTRLEQLIERFNSKAQAKFYIERSGGDFDFFEIEHNTFYDSLSRIQQVISRNYKNKVVYRSFLPNYLFAETDLIVVLGQDGLLANTAKYAKGIPILGVNPEPERYDGILLKFSVKDVKTTLKRIEEGDFDTKKVTMARATLNDGQTLLAFNDFYIGANSHVSSRYSIEYHGMKERQSSSGILVATGAGSTGWMSSVYNMVYNVLAHQGQAKSQNRFCKSWEDNSLTFVVREPFLSKTSQTSIGFGVINKGSVLKIESHMPNNGVIFSDGIESDFLHFNSGHIVEIGIADDKANLIV
jgi:NAD kinase